MDVKTDIGRRTSFTKTITTFFRQNLILFDFLFLKLLYEVMFLIFKGRLFHIIAPLKPKEHLS